MAKEIESQSSNPVDLFTSNLPSPKAFIYAIPDEPNNGTFYIEDMKEKKHLTDNNAIQVFDIVYSRITVKNLLISKAVKYGGNEYKKDNVVCELLAEISLQDTIASMSRKRRKNTI